MLEWFSHAISWLYQVYRFIATMSGADAKIFWGFLMILGFLGLGIVVALMFSRRKSQEIV